MPGESGKTTVRNLARGSPAEIPRATLNEVNTPLKSTKNVWLEIYRTHTRATGQDIVASLGQWLDSTEYHDSWHRPDCLINNLGMVIYS